jgi:2-methylisocitrate lyase-like PEP mutase family enzyme
MRLSNTFESFVIKGIHMSSKYFHALHQAETPLLLPNAWDAGSARLIEVCGAQAIATTSAGLAWACGYPDGNAIPKEELIATAKRIARVIKVPLSMDIEEGLSSSIEQVTALAETLIGIGVAGINIEDGAEQPELLCRKIEAIRSRAQQLGSEFFINARTDVYLRQLAQGPAALEETLRRGKLYRDAGCDGLFVPGLADLASIRAAVQALGSTPLNVMWLPGLSSLHDLHSAGVRRISAGAAISKNIVAQTQALTQQFLQGEWGSIAGADLGYAVVNGWFKQEDK